jgi:hypothetical protein
VPYQVGLYDITPRRLGVTLTSAHLVARVDTHPLAQSARGQFVHIAPVVVERTYYMRNSEGETIISVDSGSDPALP